ncbi:MAG: hypothetical protein HKN43_13430 [Rhodothermales bacterium]|nr:hypothetical protein [Rhodothermales bacterium]
MRNRFSDWPRTLAVLLLLFTTSFALVTEVQSQDLPLLSGEIKTKIDNDGIDAAKEFFDDIFPDKLGMYKFDNQAFGTLASDYMQAGNMDAGLAVSEMYTALLTVTIRDLIPPDVAKMLAEEEEKEKARKQQRAQEAALAKEAEKKDYEEMMGPTRDDLHRFVGQYGDPGNEDTTRRLWVSQTCEGRLVVGAMMGDAAPWYLTSAGDSKFTVDNDWQQLTVRFENNSSGKAIGIIHSLNFLPSELQRVDDLPPGRSDCMETGR